MNEAERFLLYFMQDLKAKKFCLVFPEGKGLVEGWFLMVDKLRALGVSTPAEGKSFFGQGGFSPKKVVCSSKENG